MKTNRILAAAMAFFTAGWCVGQAPAAPASATHALSAGTNGQFVLDGKPFQIRAGEMHYPRVPRAYWRDRMRKMKAMGLNTLTTYVFWNLHEPSPRQFDFTGQNDLSEYLREAQQEGLYVILRPGPYVCAEWEFGGYPAWLLKDREMKIRSSDPRYMAAVRAWFARLGSVVHPMMGSQGGPIIAVQVENEYGAFGDERSYMEAIKNTLIADGMGDGYLYTADGASYFQGGSLPELSIAVNGGAGDLEKSFAALKAARPNGPMMTGEYWDGWFDHWGDSHQKRPAAVQIQEIQWMMDRGYSFNLYMEEGGTTFGWMNGANSDGKDYAPDTTSYDYDVPIGERGELRPKFFALRDIISKATGTVLPPPPPPSAATSYAVLPRLESASLWQNLPQPKRSKALLSMEDLDQAFGYILYSTRIPADSGTALEVDTVHDYASVYVEHALVGTLDRRLGQSTMTLPSSASGKELQILVENTGRVNYTAAIRGERQGITSKVTLGGKTLEDWQIYSLPMNHVGSLSFRAAACSGPCFFRTTFMATATGSERLDTYLNVTGIDKGFVWIGERPLGRAWKIGPQGALYLPGPWLKDGANEIEFFDLAGGVSEAIGSIDHPLFLEPRVESPREK